MELPLQYRKLYKHWEHHTRELNTTSVAVNLEQTIYSEIVEFVNERMRIFEKKHQGRSLPFTSDPILSNFRFCNIYRELDRQTVHFHALLKPLENNFELWLLNMLFCRNISRTETIEHTGLLSRDATNNEHVYQVLSSMPSPKYGNAYIFPISVIQKSTYNTREKFFCRYYSRVAAKLATEIRKLKNSSVADALEILLPVLGFPLKFLLTEVLIDVAYQFPQHIDLFKWFPVGPGSIPTMKRLAPRQNPEDTLLQLTQIGHHKVNLLTLDGKSIWLSAENWEGIGCEFRKYTNLTNGTGRKRYFRANK